MTSQDLQVSGSWTKTQNYYLRRSIMKGKEIIEKRIVVIQDIRMSLWSMILFMTKLAIATLPFTIILSIVWAIFALIFMALFMPR